MPKTIEAAVMFSLLLAVSVIELLFGAALFFNAVPYASFIGTAFTWGNMVLWIIMLWVGIPHSIKKNQGFLFPTLMAVIGAIAISAPFANVIIFYEIACVTSTGLWALIACLTADEIITS